MDNIIKSAEHQWMQSIVAYLRVLFADTYIPSHNLSHHLRCWQYLKSILFATDSGKGVYPESLVESLLLATMFHDSGMVKNFGSDHGTESLRIYKDFVQQQGGETPGYHAQICTAIELHDRKETIPGKTIGSGKSTDILLLLNVADDLDALGVIGVYRYAEIYLHRGIKLEELGNKILENVNKRFDNFLGVTIDYPELKEQWKSEYNDIVKFFEQYNYQINSGQEVNHNNYRGPLGVVNYIYKFSILQKMRPADFLTEVKKHRPDIYVNAFFHKLRNDLNEKVD